MFKRKKGTDPVDLQAFDREVAKLYDRHGSDTSTDRGPKLERRIETVALYAVSGVPIRRD
jgi:hypothetical protein